MQTKLEKLQKQILLNTEITAIMKQSNLLMDIVKQNQEEVSKLKAENDRLEKEIQADKNKPDHGFSFQFKGRL